MKLKRIVVAMAAGVMAASVLSFGANAAEPFGLYYTITAPSSSNRTEQDVGVDVFYANTPLYYHIRTTIGNQFSANGVTTQGYIKSGGTWIFVVSQYGSSVGTLPTASGYYPYMPTDAPGKNKMILDYSGYNTAKAYGTTRGY